MTPYYNKPLQLSNNIGFSLPQVKFNGKPDFAVSNGFSTNVTQDTYGYSSNPLNATSAQIEEIVMNNPKLRDIVYNRLCKY